MKTGTTNRGIFEREQELLDFARCYLSEAFPNTERFGCPPDPALKTFAIQPRNSDPSLGGHITLCSPCFKAYLAHLARAKSEVIQRRRIQRTSWIRRSIVVLGSPMILIIVAYLFISPRTEPHQPAAVSRDIQSETAAYIPTVIDLSKASPIRGSGGSPTAVPQVIPSTRLDLSLRLPLGSEERMYSITLRSGGNVVWSDSVQARQQNGDTILRTLADFSHIPAGSYELQATSSDTRLMVEVLIKTTLPKDTGQDNEK